MIDKERLETSQADHFMKWITEGPFTLLERPDVERPSRPGGYPDFRFKADAGHEYVLELTRLLAKELKNLEKFAIDSISTAVDCQLSGTYTLGIPVDYLGRARIKPEAAKQTVIEILELIRSGALGETAQLTAGFTVSKVRDDGSRLVPWLISPKLPPDLKLDDPRANELEKEFCNIVLSADHKFQGFAGRRIILISLSQSGLDWQFHAQRFRDSKGVMLTWAENVCKMVTNVDFIYLEPGVNVWHESSKVFTGHKYANSPAGYYVLLWQRSRTTTLPD